MVSKVALVFGVGARRGLGGAIAAKLAKESFHVVMVGRTAEKLKDTQTQIENSGGSASWIAMKCIGPSHEFQIATTDTKLMEEEIISAFNSAADHGKLELVVQNHGPNMFPPTGPDMRNMTLEFNQYMWDNNYAISFFVGRETVRRLLPPENEEVSEPCQVGTLIFTGATGSVRGKPPFVAFAQAKAGVRMLAQSMSREYGPRGLHVAHVIIDAVIAGERIEKVITAMPQLGMTKERIDKTGMNLDGAAELFYHLHTQHPNAWSHETEVRPYSENW
eukprot:Clim_evm2s226 gene=Clim_evmTU2s226